MHHEEEIRLMAYRIWEDQGRQDGRDVEQWLKAEATWQQQTHGQQTLLHSHSQHAAAPQKVAGSGRGHRSEQQPRHSAK
jgi:hypothetical protein